MKLLTFLQLLIIALTSCGQTKSYDLAIKNATVFESKSGTLSLNQTILIKAGIIIKVVESQKNYSAIKIINAKGKLVTPGFIDTHIHPTDIFGDYNAAPEYLAKDSLLFYSNGC